MVIIGTGGLAKDLVGSLARDFRHKDFYFYNDRSDCLDELFVNRYPIIKSKVALIEHFTKRENLFVSAIANPVNRLRMTQKAKMWGGVLTTVIALRENVSEFSNISKGCIIQPDVVVSSCVTIGEGAFLNCGVIIGHDVSIGEYCSFGPGARVLGNVSIGSFSYIGCNSVILPGIKIGNKVRIGVGKIIDSDIPDGTKIV
jgi:sugar O-acyltransferase (sialic acid O-acetyltransferase NeuD family)